MDFVIGGLAGAGATVFTNPMDVVKTRLQLQGELTARTVQKSRYKGIFHGIYVIIKADGLLALQKGLVPAMTFGFCMNSVRLGIFRVAEVHGWTKTKEGGVSVGRSAIFACSAGLVSGVIANPMSVLKTRLQSAAHSSVAVGKQHEYKGTIDGFVKIYKTEGLRGLFAGVNAACFRLAVGSGAQLTSFAVAKESLNSRDICTDSPVGMSFLASALSGVILVAIICPLDVVCVRLYNQEILLEQGYCTDSQMSLAFVSSLSCGVLTAILECPFDVIGPQSTGEHYYNGLFDCFKKILRTEGLHGLYKGIGPLYLRIAPHTTISLVIWDMLNVTFNKDIVVTVPVLENMIGDFIIGGLAGVGAGFFSNPFDVIKIRMQLQGELKARGEHAVYYRNIPHAAYTIVKHDGLASLQKGLVPALWFQLIVNGVRLGIYQQADNYGLLRDENNNTKFANSLFFGLISGMSGGLAGSPLQLVKTQLMSYSNKKIAVGTQHAHQGTLYALRQIYNKNGLLGLWRGAHGMMLRNSIGSSTQIAAFAICKEWMDNNGFCQQSKYLSAFVASNIGAVAKTITLTPMDNNHKQTMSQDIIRDITDMAMGGTSAMFATLFTNPIEVVKTRLQLQGELSKGKHTVIYRNVPHALFVIARSEGLVALQSGLPAMLGFQFCLNTFRLGVYRISERRGFTITSEGRTSVVRGALAAGVGGALGSIAGTPFFLVKTRLQAQSAKAIAVGHQHTHSGTWDALRDIYRKEGVKGLFRGVGPQIPRGAVGSGSQMVSFAYAKEWLRDRGLCQSPLLLSFMGANLGGIVMTLCLNPFDVLATRLSNQPVDINNRGKLYKGMTDCFIKMLRSEGGAAFYKGLGANYLRLGPHTVLLLVCWDQLKLLEEYFRS
ncbi:unnamed protein product, partial [Leptidea sinapis]